MKVWVSLPFLPLEVLPDLVVELEGVGVEGVTFADHLCVPASLGSDYPYSGKPVTVPLDTEFPDPIVLISSLSARTTTLRFMTYVLIAPLRHPLLLAKELATVAALSGGRVDVGVGVGWMREEFDAIGVPFEHRGAITDESLDIMRRLWTGEVVAHDGEHFRFEPLTSLPTPPNGRVTLLGGGYSAPAMRRASRLDGWLGITPRLDELQSLLDKLRQVRAAEANASDPFIIRSGVKGTLTDERLAEVRQLDIDALVVSPYQLGVEGAPVDEIVSRSISEAKRIVDAVDRG